LTRREGPKGKCECNSGTSNEEFEDMRGVKEAIEEKKFTLG